MNNQFSENMSRIMNFCKEEACRLRCKSGIFCNVRRIDFAFQYLFDYAVRCQVGISSYGRRKVAVFFDCKTEMRRAYR